MYTFNPNYPEVREGQTHYPAGGPDPEEYPAEMVLRDLSAHGTPEAAPLILARYAALRAWLLGMEGSPPEMLDHARAAARAHLDAAPDGWAEGGLLRRLVEFPAGAEEPCRLLVQVAGTAEAEGHIDSALAAWSGACAAALRLRRFDLAAGLALQAAEFLRRRGARDRAASWERAAHRLAQAGDGTPPSES
jgi:hypothetical protein